MKISRGMRYLFCSSVLLLLPLPSFAASVARKIEPLSLKEPIYLHQCQSMDDLHAFYSTVERLRGQNVLFFIDFNYGKAAFNGADISERLGEIHDNASDSEEDLTEAIHTKNGIWTRVGFSSDPIEDALAIKFDVINPHKTKSASNLFASIESYRTYFRGEPFLIIYIDDSLLQLRLFLGKLGQLDTNAGHQIPPNAFLSSILLKGSEGSKSTDSIATTVSFASTEEG